MKTPYGDRIKAFATASAILWAIFALFGAIACFAAEGESYHYDDPPCVWIGLGILIFGAFAAWGSYVLISGFGELVENSEMITAHLGLKVAAGGSVPQELKQQTSQESVQETPQEKCDIVRDVVYTCKGCGQEKLCKELRVTNENGQTRYVHYCDECLKNN